MALLMCRHWLSCRWRSGTGRAPVSPNSCIGASGWYTGMLSNQAAGLRGIGFFLFQIGYPIAFTQLFQGTTQIAQANLSEMLIFVTSCPALVLV